MGEKYSQRAGTHPINTHIEYQNRDYKIDYVPIWQMGGTESLCVFSAKPITSYAVKQIQSYASCYIMLSSLHH